MLNKPEFTKWIPYALLTSQISSSPITPKGTIVAPNFAAILINSGFSGQNSLYSSPYKVSRCLTQKNTTIYENVLTLASHSHMDD